MKNTVIDKTGKVIEFEGDFKVIGSFSEELARFETKTGFFGFVNKLGEVVICPDFHDVGNFSDGLCSYVIADKIGYINKLGESIIESDFDWACDFSNGLAITKKKEQTFIINKNGESILSLDDEEILIEVSGDLIVSEELIVAIDPETEKFGFININGEFVIEPFFENASSFSEGLA